MQLIAHQTPTIVANQMTWEEFLDQYVPKLEEKTIVAITSKVVSLCEGRVVPIEQIAKDELIKLEADRYLPRDEVNHYSLTIKNDILIPAAGIDESNTGGFYVLWPEDAQRSADQARAFLAQKFGLKNIGVIITDSKTTPLRWGVTGVGLAGSGFKMLNNYIGSKDLFDRELEVTQVSMLDGLAAAAVLMMGEGAESTPLVTIQNAPRVQWQDRAPTTEEKAALQIDLETDLYGRILRAVDWQAGGEGQF